MYKVFVSNISSESREYKKGKFTPLNLGKSYVSIFSFLILGFVICHNSFTFSTIP